MTHRVMITLPDPLGEQLDQHATRTGQRASTAAAQLVRDALSRPADTKTRTASASVTRSQTNERTAPWIEPTDTHGHRHRHVQPGRPATGRLARRVAIRSRSLPQRKRCSRRTRTVTAPSREVQVGGSRSGL